MIRGMIRAAFALVLLASAAQAEERPVISEIVAPQSGLALNWVGNVSAASEFELGFLRVGTLAERTAATTHPLTSAGATEANDTSPHRGAALRQRRGCPSATRSSPARSAPSGRAPESPCSCPGWSKKPTPQPSAFISPCFCLRGA